MNQFAVLLKIYDFLRPVLDIGILTFLLYKCYEIITKTNALQLIKAGIIVILSFGIIYILDLRTLRWLFAIIGPGLVAVFAIVFQPEFRKIFLKIGQADWFTFGNRTKHTYVDSVIIAADLMSKQKRGMLCVFLRKTKHDDLIGTGTRLNADLSVSLLSTIFAHNTALHDGACFIQGGKVIAAGCFLPLSEQYDIKKTFGTRHRAALGMSEVSDCVVLVVSEETGGFSLAYDSKLHYDLTLDQVTHSLERLLEVTPKERIIEDTIDEHKANS